MFVPHLSISMSSFGTGLIEQFGLFCPAPISEMSPDSDHCARCGCLTANRIIVTSNKTSETNVDNSDAGCQSGLKRLASSQNLLTGDDVGVKGFKDTES